MKKLFLALFVLTLQSCLTPDQTYTGVDPRPICPMNYSATTSVLMPSPEPLPNLNVNPIYLEMRAGWQKTSASNNLYFSQFRLINTLSGIQTEIIISQHNSATENTFKCKKNIPTEQLNDLKIILNESHMCKAQTIHQDSCSLAMVAPQSLYLIDEKGPQIINLSLFGYDSLISFCNYDEVINLETAIENIYLNTQINTDCEEMLFL